ncbi:MAG: zinc transporter ZntB [Gammaproteobacteria bacterium]|nr:zinc transporter ZntB [Gammaproteobacteria bacterium]MDH3435359.1 zinc transporter ZntB [Gammaproteobacteria bacterium]
MTATKPEFLHAAIFDGKGSGKEIDSAGVEQWSRDQGVLWVHIDVADSGSGDWLGEQSGLPIAAIETLLAGETRPRSTFTEHGLLIVLRGVNTNPGADPEDMVSVRVWIDANRVITSRRRRLLSIQDVRKSLASGEGPRSSGGFLGALVERLADRIGDFVDSIEDRMDAAEEEIASGRSAGFRQRLSALRRQIAHVRRFLAPQRDALDRLNRQTFEWLSEIDAHALRQEADRITRYLEDLDLAKERAIVLQEELLSQVAQEQNTRMYVLSVVAAVFLPLTFVTGLLGMNVGGLPGLESPLGFVWSVVVMVVAAVGLMAFFRWKRWF